MALLNGATAERVRKLLVELPRPVTLVAFVRTGADDGEDTDESDQRTRELVHELAAISNGKVLSEVHDFDAARDEARLYGIDKTPALVVLGDESGRRDFGIRFYGAPVGYEFSTLIEDIRMVSQGATGLAQSTLDTLSRLTEPVHVQVFVTPSCPYCPRAVFLAHRMAFASDLVTADAVDASEFPALADRFRVQGVPRTVVNDVIHVEGAVPESVLMDELAPLLHSTVNPAV